MIGVLLVVKETKEDWDFSQFFLIDNLQKLCFLMLELNELQVMESIYAGCSPIYMLHP